jgi:hypothetical protein
MEIPIMDDFDLVEFRHEQLAPAYKVEGETDAAFGASPKSKDVAYLDGYFGELRRRFEQGEHLEIRWLSESYRLGAFDAPSWFEPGEKF